MSEDIDLFEQYGIQPPRPQQQSTGPDVDLFEQYGIKPPSQQKPWYSPSEIGKASLQQILGAGDEAQNLMASGLNLIPGVNLPYAKTGQGMNYEIGKGVGDVFGAAAGGGALRAAKSVPYLEKLAQFIFGAEGRGADIGRQALGGAAFGTLANPEDRSQGAMTGGAIGAGAESLGAIPGAISKVTSKISPHTYMEEMSKSIADSLQGAKNESNSLYNPVMNAFGSQPIILKDLNTDILKRNADVNSMYKKFKEDPTIGNAHRLQSELGTQSRELKEKGVASKDRKSSYDEMRRSIQQSINKTLGSKVPEAADQYTKAAAHYKTEVVPRELTHNAIQDMVQKTPEKVARKLEAVTKHKQYPKIEKGVNKIPLVPKDIQQHEKVLNSRIRNRNISQALGGAALGGTLAHSLQLPLGSEIIGMALGGGAPTALKRLKLGKGSSTNLDKNDKSTSALAAALAKIYGITKQAAIPIATQEANR
jgi:hypothetical protein